MATTFDPDAYLSSKSVALDTPANTNVQDTTSTFDPDAYLAKKPLTESSEAPILGNPFKGPAAVVKSIGSTFMGGVKAAQSIPGGFNLKGGPEMLHTLGQEASTIGQTFALPLTLPISALATTFPRATQTIGNFFKKAAESEAPYPSNPYPGMTGGSVSSNFAEPLTPDKTLKQMMDEHPRTKQALGDLANVASLVPAGAIGRTVAKAEIAGAKSLGVAAQADRAVNKLAKAEDVVSTAIDAPVQSLFNRASPKVKETYQPGYASLNQAYAGLKKDLQQYGFEKYFIPGKENHLAAQDEALSLAKSAVDKADKQAVIQMSQIKPMGSSGMYTVLPTTKNPLIILDDAYQAEKARGAKGLFSTDPTGKANKKRYEAILKSFAKEYYKPLSAEDLIDFRRDVINKEGIIFDKSANIIPSEKVDSRMRKFMYHAINDELEKATSIIDPATGKIIAPSPYTELNQHAKKLFNLAEAFESYAPVKPSTTLAGKVAGHLTKAVPYGSTIREPVESAVSKFRTNPMDKLNKAEKKVKHFNSAYENPSTTLKDMISSPLTPQEETFFNMLRKQKYSIPDITKAYR